MTIKRLPLNEDRRDDVVGWRWPAAPPSFRLYDKYADREAVVGLGERSWTVPRSGAFNSIHFAADTDQRKVQQMLVMLTQADSTPSNFVAFATKLSANWELCKRALLSGADGIRRFWDSEVPDVGRAMMCKAVLKLACNCSAGPWHPRYLALVESLATRSSSSSKAHRARVKKRDSLVAVDDQAAMTRILDEASGYDLRETHAEGLTALALMYQHAMRPVQLLALRTEHLQFVRDATDELVCVISFHSAKQRASATFEIPRQVKHEWVHIVQCLHAHAVASGRARLFCVTTVGELWTRVRRVCAIFGAKDLTFSAINLRHTGAQALADAGHDRESIRNFLGHKRITAARAYVRASRQQGELINRALGTSKLYGNILSLARGEFVTLEEMMSAAEDQQIGGVVGDRLVAGIGLCRSGQSHCVFNPVTSCYGCSNFMPSLNLEAHKEAVSGMRTQVLAFAKSGQQHNSPAALQLTQALAGAQQAIDAISDSKRAST